MRACVRARVRVCERERERERAGEREGEGEGERDSVLWDNKHLMNHGENVSFYITTTAMTVLPITYMTGNHFQYGVATHGKPHPSAIATYTVGWKHSREKLLLAEV